MASKSDKERCFNIQSNAYLSANLIPQLSRMRREGAFCDLRLEGPTGRTYPVHSCVVATQSTLLWQALKASPKTVQLSWMSEASIQLLIGYLYGENLSLSLEQMQRLKEASDILKITALHTICDQMIKVWEEKTSKKAANPTSVSETSSKPDAPKADQRSPMKSQEMDTGPCEEEDDVHIMFESIKSECIECKVCNAKVASMEQMKKHMKVMHGTKYMCEQCGEGFKYHLPYKKHVERHGVSAEPATGEIGEKENDATSTSIDCQAGPYKCRVCDESFERLSILKKHEKRHMKDSAQVVDDSETDTDTEVTVTKPEGSFEAEINKPVEQYKYIRRFVCSICGKALGHPYNLRRHIRKGHANLDTETVEKAISMIPWQPAAEEEKEATLDKSNVFNQDAFSCRICGTEFSILGNMRRHVRTMHADLDKEAMEKAMIPLQFADDTDTGADASNQTGDHVTMELCNDLALLGDYNCSICGKEFTLPSSLSVHIRKFHSDLDEKTIHKAITMVSSDLPTLTDAELAESKEEDILERISKTKVEQFKYLRRFICPICGKEMAFPHNLRRHIQTAHNRFSKKTAKKAIRLTQSQRNWNTPEKSTLPAAGDDGTTSAAPGEPGAPSNAHTAADVGENSSFSFVVFNESAESDTFLPLRDASEDQVTQLEATTLPEKKTSYGHESFAIPTTTDDIQPSADTIRRRGKARDVGVIYECTTCKMKITGLKQFKKHMETEHKRSHACEVCGLTFVSLEVLETHMKQHSEPSEAATEAVDTANSGADETSVQHDRSSAPSTNTSDKGQVEKPYACPICGSAYTMDGNLARHMRVIHKSQGEAALEKLRKERKESEKGKRKRHMQSYKCPICGIVIIYPRNMRKHLQEEHDIRDEETFQACKAGMSKENERVLTEMLTVFPCHVCSRTFSFKPNLQRHLFTVHKIDKIKPYKCDKCGVSYAMKAVYEKHMKSHGEHVTLPRKDFPKKCDQCDVMLKNQYRLTLHRALKHGGERFDCKYCTRQFLSRKALAIHIDRHEKKYKYFCEECGMGFAAPDDLAYHKETKHSSVSYLCSVCPATLGSLRSLRRHERSHERVFVCELCDFQNFSQSIVRDHYIQAHTPDTFECELCGRSYPSPRRLRIHQRDVHPDYKPEFALNVQRYPKPKGKKYKKSKRAGNQTSYANYRQSAIIQEECETLETSTLYYVDSESLNAATGGQLDTLIQTATQLDI